jgi:hypothetical protein
LTEDLKFNTAEAEKLLQMIAELRHREAVPFIQLVNSVQRRCQLEAMQARAAAEKQKVAANGHAVEADHEGLPT